MPWNFFQSLIRLFSDHCNVDLSHDRVHAFPSWGLYPAQSKMVREEYFPTITQVNKKDVQNLLQINAGFRSFMEALVKHKVTLGIKVLHTFFLLRFWSQKLILFEDVWLIFLDPETDKYWRFLGPETDTFWRFPAQISINPLLINIYLNQLTKSI